MSDWSPEQYLKFADERSRPARDLLARIPLTAPEVVFDLGCGPGNSTAVLAEAFPRAKLTGADNSPAMLAAARKAVPTAEFVDADLSAWKPPVASDLLFSNATFQWLPNHLPLLQGYLMSVRPGGVVAIQMPDNLDEPSHALMRETAEHGPWAEKLRAASVARAVLPSPSTYYTALRPLCRQFDIWHTHYQHALDGVGGIVSWLQSTGLRPFLAPLDGSEQAAFLDSYTQRLATAYPSMADHKVLLRFPRLFMVCVK